MRKLAFRYRRVKELYNTYKNNIGGEFNSQNQFRMLIGLNCMAMNSHRGGNVTWKPQMDGKQCGWTLGF